MNDLAVVVNDCAAVSVVGGPISIRSRDTLQGQRNFLFNFGKITAGLPRQLNDLELDLAEIAGHLFAVDLACMRGHGDVEWGRSIEAHLPVRDPDYWRTLAPQLESIFGDFTQDRLRLAFHADPQPDRPPRQRRDPFAAFDCVALVSGGVDSYVGGLSLLDEGRQPLAVSHTAAGAITHAQTEVARVLGECYEHFERVGFTAQKYGSTFPQPEASQRSRSLLFLTLASIVAAVSDQTDVYINENGIMAINLPLTVARIGSLSTRTASPSVLSRLEALLGTVLEVPIEIKNLLIDYTKPEVVDQAQALNGSASLVSTVSCWSIGRTSQHCGVCVPCIMRRISFELHNVPDVEYRMDAFGDLDALSNDMACDNLVHMVRTIQELNSLSDLDLQIEYPELLNGSPRLNLQQTIDLHRRWATEVLEVISGYPMVMELN